MYGWQSVGTGSFGMLSEYFAFAASMTAFAIRTCAWLLGCTPSSEMQAPKGCVALARFGTVEMPPVALSATRSGFGSM